MEFKSCAIESPRKCLTRNALQEKPAQRTGQQWFQLASEAAAALEYSRAFEAARRALLIATERRDSELITQIVALIDRARLRASARPIID